MRRSTSTSKQRVPQLRYLLVFLFACSLLSAPASTPAEEAATEERTPWTTLHERGLELYRQTDFAAAALAFEQAQRLGAPAANLYNLARCYQRLGRHREALAAYDLYISLPDLPEDRRAQARQHRDESAGQLANLEVRSAPPGAEVRIEADGQSDLVNTPATLLLDPGIYRLVFRLETRAPETREVQLATGQHEVVEVIFAAQHVPDPPIVEDDLPQEAPAPRSRPVGRARWERWLLFGGGLTITAVGAVLWGLAYSSSLRAEPFAVIDDYQEWQDRTYDLALAGDLLAGIGAAITVAGLVWLIVDAISRRSGRRTVEAGLEVSSTTASGSAQVDREAHSDD